MQSPPGSPIPGILQARTLEWVAISFSGAWKWKVEVKPLSHVWLLVTPWPAAYQVPPSTGSSKHEYWSGLQFICVIRYFRYNTCIWKSPQFQKLFTSRQTLLDLPHQLLQIPTSSLFNFLWTPSLKVGFCGLHCWLPGYLVSTWELSGEALAEREGGRGKLHAWN